MELIFGFIMCGVVTVAVQVYLRLFATEGARHRPFERWCRTQPLVMAVRCRTGAAVEVYERLRWCIEPHDYFSNSQGRFPWQHYAVRVDGRRVEGDLVLLFVRACRQPRLQEKLPDLSQAIESLGRTATPLIEEVWLHGQLHAVNRRTGVEREQLAWLGSFEESGALDVTAMIGRPRWLARVA